MPAKTINVKNAAELTAAIKTLKGGETILLAAGNYGDVVVNSKVMSERVTFKSADASNDAVLTGLTANRSSNIVFEDIDIHHVLKPGEADFTAAVNMGLSSRIALNGIDVYGTMDGTPMNDGVGMRITACTNMMVTNSTFEQLGRAAVFSRDSALVVSGNTISNVREGLNFNAVHQVQIEKNLITDVIPNIAAKDHPDAIQFWNYGVKQGSSDVIIRDNVILSKTGNFVQGIFIGAEDPLYRHSDFLIENNVYSGDARNGIALGRVDNAVIRGNTLTTTANGLLETAIRLDDSSNIVVEKNISPLILLYRSTAVTQQDNIDVWDRTQRKGIAMSELFADTTPGTYDQHDFTVASGSAADKVGAGFHAVPDVGIATPAVGLAHAYTAYAHVFEGSLATMNLV